MAKKKKQNSIAKKPAVGQPKSQGFYQNVPCGEFCHGQLFEVLPRDTEDWKLTNALLSERETLRMEEKPAVRKGTLFYPAEDK